MTEPQVWVIIGVFAAALFGVLGTIVPLITRTITAEIRGQSGELRVEIANLGGEIAAVEHRLSAKITALDGDVQAISRQVFGRGGDLTP
ncbi:MAG TPA: hypothetical protein PK781_10390 [Terrimesophilobacter sp.]|nr:hypothetical protein [Terrimesophilobacter sp.]